MYVIIKRIKSDSADIIECPDGTNASKLVEAWQKNSIRYKVRGELPAVVWKVAKSKTFVDAMIESSSL